jgi:hypothetical protein
MAIVDAKVSKGAFGGNPPYAIRHKYAPFAISTCLDQVIIPFRMAPFIDLHLNTPKITNGAKGASIKT